MRVVYLYALRDPPLDAGDGDMSSAVMEAMAYEGRKAGRVIRVNRTKTSGGYGVETGTEK